MRRCLAGLWQVAERFLNQSVWIRKYRRYGLSERLPKSSAVVIKRITEAARAARLSSVKVIVLPLIIIIRWRRRRFFLEQLFPVKGAGGIEFQPRSNALKIKLVVLVAREHYDERVLVSRVTSATINFTTYGLHTFEKGIAANGAIVRLLQRLIWHSIETVDEAVRDTFDFCRGIVRSLP